MHQPYSEMEAGFPQKSKMERFATRVSQMESTCRGQFGQNGQKLHENYKINIFKAEQWEGHGGAHAKPCNLLELKVATTNMYP